ncbi:uncharacterized protein LOC132941842 [Metopolophium dirhodum]|uniref:uncharacterized protein LOC132941842 n=1 Tax=Metopolophium dirhodum TaxID=44670 RepID=UPI00298FF0E2|nr:uncharacterized protein LOC132941842 [Metopolophium dirhodum]
MMGHWIFVLLCLSFVGQLVLGSLFPPIPPNAQNPSQPDAVPPQQEVNWPLNNLATPEVIVVGEAATLNTRSLHMEKTRDKPLETSQKSEEILPKVIVIGTEQKAVGEIVTRNNAEMETKNLSSTNNG